MLMVKNLPTSAGDVDVWVWSLGWEDPLEEGMATYSSLLAWRIPWTEEPGGLQSVHKVAKSGTWLKQFSMHTRLAGQIPDGSNDKQTEAQCFEFMCRWKVWKKHALVLTRPSIITILMGILALLCYLTQTWKNAQLVPWKHRYLLKIFWSFCFQLKLFSLISIFWESFSVHFNFALEWYWQCRAFHLC